MHTTTSIAATDLAEASAHCEHDRGARSFAIGRHPAHGYVMAEHPDELDHAAEVLAILAADWRLELADANAPATAETSAP